MDRETSRCQLTRSPWKNKDRPVHKQTERKKNERRKETIQVKSNQIKRSQESAGYTGPVPSNLPVLPYKNPLDFTSIFLFIFLFFQLFCCCRFFFVKKLRKSHPLEQPSLSVMFLFLVCWWNTLPIYVVVHFLIRFLFLSWKRVIWISTVFFFWWSKHSFLYQTICKLLKTVKERNG